MKSYSQLRGEEDENNNNNNNTRKSSCRSSSFHKAITKMVLRGLQELTRLRSNNSYTSLNAHERGYASGVPKGYLAVHVGEKHEQERFVVKTQHLHHPIFKVLLKKCEEEFGFCQRGPLLIPCKVDLFHLLLWHIENSDMVLDSSQAQELVDLYLVSLTNLDANSS